MIKVELLQEKDCLQYSKFLKNIDNSTIYHSLEWKEVLKSSYHFDPFYLIARDENDDIRAILPLFYIKNFSGSRLDSLPFSIYGGVLGDKEYVKPLIKQAFELKKEMKCDYIIFKQPPHDYRNMFEDSGMGKDERWLNQYLRIKDPNVLWKEIKKSNRNIIRKGIKNNIKVERATNESDLEELYTLELITRKRQGVPTPPINHFKNMWRIMYPKGYLEVFTARYQGRAIASALLLIFNKKVIYAIGASETESMKLRPNNLLLWKAIEWSYTEKYEYFDLGGTPRDLNGLIFFKSSFNTANIPYSYYYLPPEKASENRKKSLAMKIGEKFFNKMPIWISKMIGPHVIKNFG